MTKKSQNLMNFRVDSAFFVRFCDSPRNNEKRTRFCELQNLIDCHDLLSQVSQ
ncbi:hypothetical protein ACWIUD_00615 [Helicobacter sp. 23-1044]